MDSQLTKILASTQRDLQERKAATSTRALQHAAAAHQPRGFVRALRQKAAAGPAVLASQSCDLPCLRKDFILDEFQLLEARAHRADAILLIAAALGDLELRQLASQAHALDLDVLCEVHTASELDRVLDLDCDAVGVNNRDLRTFSVGLEVSLALAPRLPAGALHVSESGIETAEDMHRLRAAGFHAFLIGESLMRRPDPASALENLLLAAPVGK
jgi:indole-3-glycerol phosphate synthase